jgi:hypothetical protein
MSNLYTGQAIFTFPDGPTVTADVDLHQEADDALHTWAGTAQNDKAGSLWNGGQRVATIKIGDVESGYHVGECMILAPEDGDGDAVDEDNVRRVSLRGSGELSRLDETSQTGF